MAPSILLRSKLNNKDNAILIAENQSSYKNFGLSKEDQQYLTKCFKNEKPYVVLDRYSYKTAVIFSKEKLTDKMADDLRKKGAKLVKSFDAANVQVVCENKQKALLVAEGVGIGLYNFEKYKSSKSKKGLSKIAIQAPELTKQETDELQYVLEANFLARDLVNEPVSFLTASQLAKEAESAGKNAGFSTTILTKKKIETLKMGGLLAVNQGSVDPPTFSILEHKPSKPVNKKPIILVGKGVVYDTGGLSLKPTKGSMDEMKCDMGGAAAVIGALYAVAKNKLPVHVIGLVPATDNRPGLNAYAPGDVVTMYNGLNVEVLNTDAEGRMILADALAYGEKFNPDLVIDLATLTGSAHRAVGHLASVVMGTAKEKDFNNLQKAGDSTRERVVQFPFWDEYGEMLQSDVADIKNIGGAFAGAITAGKFLEHFTKNKNNKSLYPWIHIDIAGPAFLSQDESYWKKGGTGVGVRLLYAFIKNQYLS